MFNSLRKCICLFKKILGRVKFCNILVNATLQHVYHVTKAIQAMEGPHYGWKYFGKWCTTILCIASFNVIWKPQRQTCTIVWLKNMLHKFKLGYNTMEVTKNICCLKGKDIVDHSTITRWFKEFFLGSRTPTTRLGRPKTQDSEAMLQVIEANLTSTTCGIFGKLGISI